MEPNDEAALIECLKRAHRSREKLMERGNWTSKEMNEANERIRQALETLDLKIIHFLY